MLLMLLNGSYSKYLLTLGIVVCPHQVAASICEWICERLSDYHNNFSKDTSLMKVRQCIAL